MLFLSNFGCKIIFMCSVNFWHQQDSNSLFKGSISHVTSQCKWPIPGKSTSETPFIYLAPNRPLPQKKSFFSAKNCLQIIKTKSASFECIHCSLLFPLSFSFVGVIFELIGRKKTYLSALFYLGSFSKTGLEPVKRRHEVGVY